MNSKPLWASIVVLATVSLSTLAEDEGSIAFPAGYRDWYHHHSTVNLQGHTPEGEIGIQNVMRTRRRAQDCAPAASPTARSSWSIDSPPKTKATTP
ncbi:MAG: hypothetical protein ABI612_00035 [Betaproteobacteria bacterium]